MVLFNYATKELTAKVVYYGPGLCGKTTNLLWIHEHMPIKNKGKMLSLATETDRTLFFDFLPIDLGQVRGMRMRIQLYTVPGQVFYNATRRMVLKGADAVVFVVDSQEALLDASLESFDNMRQNLEANEIDPDEIPTIFQYNKRDLPNALPIEILNERLNPRGLPYAEAVAIKGPGVEETLKLVTRVVFGMLSQRYGDGAISPLSTPAPQILRPASALAEPGGTNPPTSPGPGRTNPPAAAPFAPFSATPAPAPVRPTPVPSEVDAVPSPPATAPRPVPDAAVPQRASVASTNPPRPSQPAKSSSSSDDELFDVLDLTPLEDQLPAIDIEEEDTSPALTHRVAARLPMPAGSRETLAVAPQKAAEIRQRIVAARSVEDELGIDLSLETSGPGSSDEDISLDVALGGLGNLLGSAPHPTLAPDATLQGVHTRLVPPPAPKDSSSPSLGPSQLPAKTPLAWPAPIPPDPDEDLSVSERPVGRSSSSFSGLASEGTPFTSKASDPAPASEVGAEAQIISAQAQVSVPVEVHVPPGVNRISLSLHLVIKLKEKR